MSIRSLSTDTGRLLLCAVVLSIGTVLGGFVATALGLPQPALPSEMDQQSAMLSMLFESPLLALVLALLARHLSGGFWARTTVLFLLTWISNSVNNQIEAAAFAGMQEGFWFTIVTFLVPAALVSMAVARLFTPGDGAPFPVVVESFFGRFSVRGLIWRIAVAALIFMPIYYLFGTLVIPFTRSYYDQNLYGLEIPSLSELLRVLSIRSVLFFVACLPVLIAWHGLARDLVWRLGLALFYLVGLQPLLIANWMPWALRLPHIVEILLDEFAYACALVWLFGGKAQHPESAQFGRLGPTPA